MRGSQQLSAELQIATIKHVWSLPSVSALLLMAAAMLRCSGNLRSWSSTYSASKRSRGTSRGQPALHQRGELLLWPASSVRASSL